MYLPAIFICLSSYLFPDVPPCVTVTNERNYYAIYSPSIHRLLYLCTSIPSAYYNLSTNNSLFPLPNYHPFCLLPCALRASQQQHGHIGGIKRARDNTSRKQNQGVRRALCGAEPTHTPGSPRQARAAVPHAAEVCPADPSRPLSLIPHSGPECGAGKEESTGLLKSGGDLHTRQAAS